MWASLNGRHTFSEALAAEPDGDDEDEDDLDDGEDYPDEDAEYAYAEMIRELRRKR